MLGSLTSHMLSWKERLSFSSSSAISPPLTSLRTIPYCRANSLFSFSTCLLNTQAHFKLLIRLVTVLPAHFCLQEPFHVCELCKGVIYISHAQTRNKGILKIGDAREHVNSLRCFKRIVAHNLLS